MKKPSYEKANLGSVLKSMRDKPISINPVQEFATQDCGDYLLFGLKEKKGRKL